MNHPQQGVVYGYSELTYVSSGSAAPYIQQQPPPPSEPVPHPDQGHHRRVHPHRRPRTPHLAHLPAPDDAGLRRRRHAHPLRPEHHIPSSQVLSYNLTARLAISNPNRRVSVYYDQLQAVGFYQAEPFGRTALPVSFQGTRHADAVPAVLAGSSPMGFGDSGVQVFLEDEKKRVFPVDLWVDGVVRYKFGELTATTASTLSVKCHLALQLIWRRVGSSVL